MRKRIMYGLLVASMACGLLSGCGSKSDNAGSAETTVNAVENTSGADDNVIPAGGEDSDTTKLDVDDETFNEWVRKLNEYVTPMCEDSMSFGQFFAEGVPGSLRIYPGDDVIMFTYDASDEDYFEFYLDVNNKDLSVRFDMIYPDGYRAYAYTSNRMAGDKVEDYLDTVLVEEPYGFSFEGENTADVNVQNDLYKIYARFAYSTEKALADMGLSFETIGINYGSKYKNYSISEALDANPTVEFEKHNFESRVCVDCKKTWNQCFRDAVYAVSSEQPGNDGWAAYVFPSAPTLLSTYDYVQFNTYDYMTEMVYQRMVSHEIDNISFEIDIYDDNPDYCVMNFKLANDYKLAHDKDEDSNDIVVVEHDNYQTVTFTVGLSDIEDMMLSKESFKSTLAEIEDAEYIVKTNGETEFVPVTEISDEFCDSYLEYFKSIMKSFDYDLGEFNMSFEDIGVKY